MDKLNINRFMTVAEHIIVKEAFETQIIPNVYYEHIPVIEGDNDSRLYNKKYGDWKFKQSVDGPILYMDVKGTDWISKKSLWSGDWSFIDEGILLFCSSLKNRTVFGIYNNYNFRKYLVDNASVRKGKNSKGDGFEVYASDLRTKEERYKIHFFDPPYIDIEGFERIKNKY